MTENQIRCKVENLMAQFDVARHHHKKCLLQKHYVVIVKTYLTVLHAGEALNLPYTVLMTYKKIHEKYITEPLREVLMNRIKAYLEKNL